MQSQINIASFSHLLKRVDFDTTVDPLALTHIIKSKAEPATTRIKRLLKLISSYSFNLYYIKGKDMMLSDFLSRQKHDYSDPHGIIPISFIMYNVLHKMLWCRKDRQISSANMMTDKIKWNKANKGPWCKESLGFNYISWETENNPEIKKECTN